MKSKRALRFGGCGAVFGAVYFGVAASAMAWNEPLWVRQLGTAYVATASGVATDGEGNLYLTGWTEGSLGGANRGLDDAWVTKYDAAGHQLWVRQLGTASEDTASGVATDGEGNLYLTGDTYGPLGGANRGRDDAWVAKYDAAGNQLWVRQLGTADEDTASGVATDGEGNLYLTGETKGSLGGANRGSGDAWVAKYDTAGNQLWVRQLGTADNDTASGVATDGEGNLYLPGGTQGSLGGANRGSNRGTYDAWVAKYDTAGNQLWVRQLGTADNDFAQGVATDGEGNLYLTGRTEGSLGGANRGGRDAWVAKYDAAGHQLWKRQLGTAEDDADDGVATDGEGNLYLTGWTAGSLGGANRGSYDAWVAKYDDAGNQLWVRQLGTAEDDFAQGVATDGEGNLYLTGQTLGSLGGAKIGESYDAWVAKYSTR